MSGALILTGAPGSGKSEVLDALSTLLEIDRVRFGAIETEQLARGWPWLSLTQSLRQLSAVVEAQREAGRELLLVVATTEDELELREVVDTVGADAVVVVCLSAPPELVAARVADREPDWWPGKAGLIEHARELADVIPSIPGIDFVLGTVQRGAPDVAAEIKALLVDHGLLERPADTL